ncbi:MAG TPA: hypothetical protein VFO36_00180, partial [Nitrospiraceae bacterium]|nr:hypothetical protein [Nitrospiraceae bacterium]
MTYMFASTNPQRRGSALSTAVRTLLALSVAAAPAYVSAQETLTEVVVTGSRLVRSDLSAPSPTTVLGQDLVQMSGDTTVETVLNELPQLSGGTNSSVNS